MDVVDFLLEFNAEEACQATDSLTLHEIALIIGRHRKNREFISLLYVYLRNIYTPDDLRGLSFRSMIRGLFRDIDVRISLGWELRCLVRTYNWEPREILFEAIRRACESYMPLFPDVSYICYELKNVKSFADFRTLYKNWYDSRLKMKAVLQEIHAEILDSN